MKGKMLKITLGLCAVAFAQLAEAQCPVISCGPDVIANTDSAMCDAFVNYPPPLSLDTCNPTGSQTFVYTGSEQIFVVPTGVTMISVDAYGAQGGSNSPATNINFGGRVQADIPVTPGSTIYVYVGEQPSGLTGGWNGGGNGESAGKGGGGASDIRIGGNTLNDRVVVAGAAGGGGFWSSLEVHGGLGGDLVGGPGYRDTPATPGGDPGTQTSSGNGTCVTFNNPAVSGGFGYGGSPSGCGCEGYGGGGGWYGGAGSGNCRGGGGGSSYTIPAATNVVHTQGVRTGHGEITLSWVGVTPNVTQIAGLPSGSIFPIGATTNTFVAESGGFYDTCSMVVTVIDNQVPTLVCPADIEVCEGTAVFGPAPVTSDNCSGEFVTYTTTGATSVSGVDSLDGVFFNPGTTMVWYIVTDAAGNQDSCAISVVVHPAPAVTFAAFPSDSVCTYSSPVALPAGTPASGTYSGPGINLGAFDPGLSGEGTFYIVYSYTDSLGCIGSDSSMIVVDPCLGLIESTAFGELQVYPNPSNGIFAVFFQTQSGAASYSVTTMDGKKVCSGSFNLNEKLSIDLSAEPTGLYLLQLTNAQGTTATTLMKE